MASIDDFDQQLTNQLDKFENLIKNLSTNDYNKKQQTAKTCAGLEKFISNQIDCYDLEIQNLDQRDAPQYQASIKVIQQRFKNLKNDYLIKKSDNSMQNDLFGGRNPEEDQQQFQMPKQKQEVIQLGHNLQNQGMDLIHGMKVEVAQIDEEANNMMTALDKQIEQLDRINQDLRDTQSILKRTDKLVRYFARVIYTDKLLLALVCLIVVAIIVCIILAAVKKDNGKFNVPDVIKKS